MNGGVDALARISQRPRDLEQTPAAPTPSSRADLLLLRAEDAHAHAARLVDPPDPGPRGPAPWLAVALHREASWLALCALAAHRGQELPRTFDEALDARAAEDPDVVAELRVPAYDLAAREPRLSRRRAVEVDRWVEGLLDEARLEIRGPSLRSRVGRWPWLLAAAAVLGAILLFALRPGDKARGRPFHASSAYEGYATDGVVTVRAPGELLFHTVEETEPWVEIDLGSVRSFSRVEIRNRTDCCAERAVPLIVEVRDDAEPWREVARRDRVFTTWVAEVGRTNARFVRLRLAKRGLLHLTGVVVR